MLRGSHCAGQCSQVAGLSSIRSLAAGAVRRIPHSVSLVRSLPLSRVRPSCSLCVSPRNSVGKPGSHHRQPGPSAGSRNRQPVRAMLLRRALRAVSLRIDPTDTHLLDSRFLACFPRAMRPNCSGKSRGRKQKFLPPVGRPKQMPCRKEEWAGERTILQCFVGFSTVFRCLPGAVD